MKTLIKTQSKLLKSILAASFIGLGSAAIGGNALALEPADGSSSSGAVNYSVGYADLDASTMKGAKTLYLRIRYAAEVVCESAATWGKKEGQACVNKAVEDAVVHINRPLLSQYHQLRAQGNKTGLVQLAKAN